MKFHFSKLTQSLNWFFLIRYDHDDSLYAHTDTKGDVRSGPPLPISFDA